MKFRFRYYENRTAMGFCIGFYIFKVLFTFLNPLYGFPSILLLSVMFLPTGGLTNGLPLEIALIFILPCVLFVSIFFILLVINRRISNLASRVLLIISVADLLFSIILAIEYSFWPILYQGLSIVPLVILRHSKTDFYL